MNLQLLIQIRDELMLKVEALNTTILLVRDRPASREVAGPVLEPLATYAPPLDPGIAEGRVDHCARMAMQAPRGMGKRGRKVGHPSPQPSPLGGAREKGEGAKLRRATGKLYAKRAAWVGAIEKCGETFTAEEVVEKGGLEIEGAKLSKNFWGWVQKGWLALSAKGRPNYPAIYRRGSRWRGFAKMFHVEPEAKAEGKRLKAEVGAAGPEAGAPGRVPAFVMRGRPSKHREAVIALFEELPGPLAVGVVIEEFRKRWPEMMAKASQETDLRTRLIDMANDGLITRMGHGAGAHYSRSVRTKASAAEDSLENVRVPRDADAGREEP